MDDWWNRNAATRMGDLLNWLGPVGALTRAIMRQHVMDRGYHSMIDVGCGPAIDREGFANVRYAMDYHGVDQCEAFVRAAQDRNLQVQCSTTDSLPFPNRFVELAYCRHVLEHLEQPESTLDEMLRVASKELIVTFFLPPGLEDEPSASDDDGCRVHHNRWSERRICTHLWASDRVRRIRWQPVNEETMMFVTLDG